MQIFCKEAREGEEIFSSLRRQPQGDLQLNWAVVMAGGRGTRFWPESRAKRPKPFLKLLGRRTVIEDTVARLQPLFPSKQIYVVIQKELVAETHRLLPRIPRENILGEPVGRNTAPCCVFAAAQIARQDPNARLAFLPADQHVPQKSLFLKSMKTALGLADDRPVLIGVRPDSPNPAYGYLEVDRRKKIINGISSYTVTRFHEKPSPAKARQYLKRGNFFWNGGIFIWQLDSFKNAVQKHLPKLYPAFSSLGVRNIGPSRLAAIYRKLPSISLDYGVMEKMKNIHCLQAPFRLNDLGGWEGLTEFWPSDQTKNRYLGKTLLIKSTENIVKTNKRLIALLGVRGLLVVDTPDALLICPRSRTEEVRDVVRELERRKAYEYL